MFRDAREVLELVRPGDRVLDVGGALKTFPRADVVIDILPYEARQPGPIRDEPERFSRDSWFVGDICSREVWGRFADKEFDFVLCSHTLEDVRDPIVVCAEMVRVGRRGYLETPSRVRECIRDDPSVASAGWDHHRWLVDLEDGHLVFTGKMQWAHAFNYAGDLPRETLYQYFVNFLGVEWEGSFGYVEHIAKGSVVESENLFHLFETYPWHHPPYPIHQVKDVQPSGPTFRDLAEFQLPVEKVYDLDTIWRRYQERHQKRQSG